MDLSDLPPLVNSEDVPECVPTLQPKISHESESDCDDDSDNLEELEVDGETTICLFCDHASLSVENAIKHIDTVHDINLSQLKQKFRMDDQYSFLKFINCIRHEKITAEQIKNATKIFWYNEKYLKPVEYEPWLIYDYESLPTKDNDTNHEKQHDLETQIRILQEELQEKNSLLEQAHKDMTQMRAGFQRLFAEKESSETELSKKHVHCVLNTSLKADDSYFGSYDHFGIHHEMLSDVVRTTSYRDALLKNKNFINGKDVLDVGCGTSVLSIFASQAGAKTVIGIDNADIIYNAMDIVKKNNISNIQLVKGRLENTNLPQEKYDIIISEWMGYFLLFEGMLDTIIYARDNHLKEGGILLPNRCTMSIVGFGNETLYARHVTFWNNVYGLDMSNMQKEVIHEPLIEIVDPKFILTESNIIADLNLATVDLNYPNFSFDLQMKCTQDGTLSSFVGYFDTYFELENPIHLGTGPNDAPTHWKQVVFFLNEPRNVSVGEIIKGKLQCKRSKNSARSLDITIEIFDQLHTYYLD